MGARKAVRYLTIGEHTYAPGDEVPAEDVALVDHPDAWVDPDQEPEDDGPDPEPKKAAAKRSSSK